MRSAIACAVSVVFLAIFCHFSTASAAEDIQIVAVINKDVVTNVELARHIKLNAAIHKLSADDASSLAYREAVLRKLIQDRMKSDYVKKLGVTLAGPEIDDAAKIITGGLTTNEYLKKRHAIDYKKEFFDDLTLEVVWSRVVIGSLGRDINVSDGEIEILIGSNKKLNKNSAKAILFNSKIATAERELLQKIESLTFIDVRD